MDKVLKIGDAIHLTTARHPDIYYKFRVPYVVPHCVTLIKDILTL